MSFLDKAGDFIAHLTGTAAPGKATEAQLAAPTVDYKSEIERSRNTAAPTIAQTQLGLLHKLQHNKPNLRTHELLSLV